MKDYLLAAAFMIPSLVVLGAAVTTVSLADHDHSTAREPEQLVYTCPFST